MATFYSNQKKKTQTAKITLLFYLSILHFDAFALLFQRVFNTKFREYLSDYHDIEIHPKVNYMYRTLK